MSRSTGIWLAAIALLLAACATPQSPAPTTQPTTTPAQPTGPALVVKIDNVSAARPQTGIGKADVIYVEPVEGGLTRIAAVYLGPPPSVIGPVRSARESDIDLLAQYGKPTLACSGSAPQLLPLLRNAGLDTGTQGAAPSAYYRDSTRIAPHDLYLHPDRLPKGSGTVTPEPTGPLPTGGKPTTQQHAQVGSTGFDFQWSPPDQGWLITMDGTPMTTTDTGRLTAKTVIVENVTTRAGTVPGDVAGNPSPVVISVGTGSATLLRDGQSFQTTWSRPSPTAATTFTDATGQAIPASTGPLWILLTP